MKIGSVVLENNIFLAPMAGVTDMPFRILCREQGCGLVYTEMVSAKGMHYNDEKSAKLTEISEIERPASVQIFGSDPEIMEGIARKLDFSDASIIDINMGCPTPKITKNGEGSALMLKPRLVGDIVKSVSQATHKPVTVKIRKGWDESSVNAVEIARIAEENGAKAIAVHGRTREQLYSGSADWEIIARVKEAVSVPVIGNGDVRSPGDAERMLRQTGCDAVMVGRGAQGNPWIFRRILTYLENGALTPEPSNIEKIDMIIRHMKMLVELKGEHTGVLEMRKHIAWYIKGMRNSTYVKEKVFKLYDVDEIVQLLLEYLLQN
jgi:nifR3 family TIM-barrel protein